MPDFSALCAKAAAALPEPFTVAENATVCGREVPLYAQFHIESERKMFGIMETGNRNHCHEYRCLFSVSALTEEAAGSYCDFARTMQETLIAPDRCHEFSIVSIALVCDRIDKEGARLLKKYRSYTRYATPANGWSEVRLAALETASGKAFANVAGAPLVDWLRIAAH